MKTIMRMVPSVMAGGLVASLLSSSAFATPVGTIPMNGAFVVNHHPGLTNPYYDGTPVVNSGGSLAPASSSQAVSGEWGATGGSASANLATGTLGGRVYGNFTGQGLYENNNIYMQTNAYFGDGFHAEDLSGSPFSWGPNSTARFGLTIDGSLSASPNIRRLGSGAFVILELFQHDTLDPEHLFGYQPNALTTYFYQIGNPNLQVTSCDFNGNCTPLAPSAFVGNFDNGAITIAQDITPGIDFDWMVLLGAYGIADAPGESFDFDLSHTLTVSYEGPAGSKTTSNSGLFNNFDVPTPTRVPEPSTLLLLAVGVVAFGTLRRRKAKA